ncbi:MAG: hypothetical protein KDE09_14475 [Anaerolineales bacterium]|nr:hypothetical protein [Anaerolineales bacterium]MCB8961683.1 hypothetical protein [Ardenticatenales bacterium]MCB0008080.1 hypothetical protein [Anaerolineales bacterium]MCB0013555.1 hypothetical protein [Anaerolineales bacterium]MCB0018992.1 hypothetical protein [Anaerolineales bacterium]
MRTFDSLGKKKAVLGMLHLGTMPGTPFYEDGSYEATFERAMRDARALYEGGASGCLVQTVDRAYPAGDEADYARVVGVAHIVRAIAQMTGPEFQIGVQIMWNALKASLAVAQVSGGSFLRCTALIGATMSPAGLVQANPHDFLRYRKHIGAQNIKLVAEVDGMHFHWHGGDKTTPEVARMARSNGAHAVEVANPDEETALRLIHDIKKAMPEMPVILGGHTNHGNAARLLAKADGAFVGSCFEEGGWAGPISKEKVQAYVEIVNGLS